MSSDLSTPAMSVEEATDCLEAIRQTADVARASTTSMFAQIDTFDDGLGWRVLGFPSLMDCLKAKLTSGQSQLYIDLAARSAKKRLSTGGIDSERASKKALAALDKLPEEIQEQVYIAAEIATPAPKPVSAPAVQEAARQMTRKEYMEGGISHAGTYSKERQSRQGTKGHAKVHSACPTCTC